MELRRSGAAKKSRNRTANCGTLFAPGFATAFAEATVVRKLRRAKQDRRKLRRNGLGTSLRSWMFAPGWGQDYIAAQRQLEEE